MTGASTSMSPTAFGSPSATPARTLALSGSLDGPSSQQARCAFAPCIAVVGLQAASCLCGIRNDSICLCLSVEGYKLCYPFVILITEQ